MKKQKQDFTLCTCSLKAEVIVASPMCMCIEVNAELFALGVGRSSAGHGIPTGDDKHLLEADEFLYLKRMKLLESDFEPVSDTFVFYSHFRSMNYIPKPGL